MGPGVEFQRITMLDRRDSPYHPVDHICRIPTDLPGSSCSPSTTD